MDEKKPGDPAMPDKATKRARAVKPAKGRTGALLARLRAFGLTYPGAHSKSPWPGHDDLAVNDKTFAYLSADGEPFSISCKLPDSNLFALLLPGASPTAYGLGKSGWVTLQVSEEANFPLDEAMLRSWIDESYRAQAPRRLVKALGAVDPVGLAEVPLDDDIHRRKSQRSTR